MSTSGERVVLDTLLEVQERDTATDRLRHRRDSLDGRAVLTRAEARWTDLDARVADVSGRRDELAHDEQRLDDEGSTLEAKAAAEERRMYSGEIASPRELQAMQADVDQLRRHHRSVEDRELSVMEQREVLDEELATLRAEADAVRLEVEGLRDALARDEAVIDAELHGELAARAELAAGLGAELLDDYERCRLRARGVGAARLVGGTCQGCHLSIPATEAERIRKSPPGTIAHCDNCGCILVP